MSLRNARLSTRLGLMLGAILVLAAVAQTLLYLKTRNETVKEADDSYQSLAKAIEVAATQIGPEGWKDERVLADYRRKLAAKGLRDIQVTEAGRPFPPEPVPATAVPTPGRGALFPKKAARQKPSGPHDILISGTVGEGTPNRTLLIPLVLEGKLVAYVKISYSLENIREQLADNFRRRLYALLGVFALGLAVTLVVTRNATTPLDALDEAAKQVAAGQLDVRVPVRRDDEIGRLAATFNRMTGSLRERKELEQRLLAAERRAEIGHLASGLAHEIKNPLNALSLGLDVLRRRHSPSDPVAASEHAARIEALREEINRLTILINNFLSYGRPLSMAPQPTDMASLVHGTLSDLSETAERAHVTVKNEVPESLPPVNVDPSLLKSAVWNLVQNAVQSMEASGGTMRVSLALENGASNGSGPSGAGAGSQLVFQVEDSGPGIDPADLPRLFEPYFSRKEGGVGLGLAMVKRIVEDHGGQVAAENRDDGVSGSRFRLVLPVSGLSSET